MVTNREYLFLTGATGFIGKNFLKKAEKKGFKIFALSRKRKINSNKRVTWIKGELDSNLDKYLKQSHTLIHLAATGVNKKKNKFKRSF